MSDNHHPQALKNDETLRSGIQRAAEYYAHLGVETVKIDSVEEIPINPTHSLAKTHWLLFDKNGKELVGFDVAYVVRDAGNKLEFVFVIADDEEKQMRAKGLIPSS